MSETDSPEHSTPSPAPKVFHSGFAALVGRPNVGKSTLLNALVEHPVSIVSPRPQTTRHRILGIRTREDYQLVFMDTPGMHRHSGGRAMNRYLNRTAVSTAAEADLELFIVEALQWRAEDAQALEKLRATQLPVIAVVNKIDQARPRDRLLPFLEELSKRAEFAAVVPVSATKKENLEALERAVVDRLPQGPMLFPADQVTDRNAQFRAAEIVRQKLTMRLREELPYGLTVQIEEYVEAGRGLRIQALIWVEREGQKAIVVGKGGLNLREAGRASRLQLKREVGVPVDLRLWVKVKANWADNEQALRSLGYENP
ncbi:MAG: GTPase Era [Pseudomonadota bacterium]